MKPNVYLTPSQIHSILLLVDSRLSCSNAYLFRGHNKSLAGIKSKLMKLYDEDATTIYNKMNVKNVSMCPYEKGGIPKGITESCYVPISKKVSLCKKYPCGIYRSKSQI